MHSTAFSLWQVPFHRLPSYRICEYLRHSTSTVTTAMALQIFLTRKSIEWKYSFDFFAHPKMEREERRRKIGISQNEMHDEDIKSSVYIWYRSVFNCVTGDIAHTPHTLHLYIRHRHAARIFAQFVCIDDVQCVIPKNHVIKIEPNGKKRWQIICK